MHFSVLLSSINCESLTLFWHLISFNPFNILFKLFLSFSLTLKLFIKLFNFRFNSQIWASLHSISFPIQLFSLYKFLLLHNFSSNLFWRHSFSPTKLLILLLNCSSFIFFSHSNWSLHSFKAATSCSKLQYLSFKILKSFSRNSSSKIWALSWLIKISFSLLMQFSPYSLRLHGDLGLVQIFLHW